MNPLAPPDATTTSHSGASTEFSILLAAASPLSVERKSERLHELLRASIDWKLLLDLAEKHGLQPMLHSALSRAGAAVPADPMLALERKAQINVLKSLMVSRELIRIVERSSELGLQVMPYKGPALAELLYGDVALRQSGDIDLLIRPQDFSHACEAVRDLGYKSQLKLSPRQQRAYLKSGYEYTFDSEAGRNLLELQWAIQPRFYSVDFDLDGLFHRAMSINVAGRSMMTPSLEDLLLILSVHAAKHVWGKLVWLSDIAQLIANSALQWDQIGYQARAMGIVRILRVTMFLVHQLFDVRIPEAAERNVPQDAQSSIVASQIVNMLASQAEPDVESLPYFRLMLRLRERSQDRLRFVQRLAFTPGPSEWNAVHLPEFLFPLYRMVRLGRLAAKVLPSR